MISIFFKQLNKKGIIFKYRPLFKYGFDIYSDEIAMKLFYYTTNKIVYIIENKTIRILSYPFISMTHNPSEKIEFNNIRIYNYVVDCNKSIKIKNINIVNKLKMQLL